MSHSSLLRPITSRLTSVPVEDLPQLAGFLATCIANCGPILSAPDSSNANRRPEDTVLVHKLKTRVSSLLHDRSPRGRWTGVVLVKAILEVGGFETLKGCAPWARALLSILGKPNPPSAKKIATIALTRLFMLAQEYPTLIREITTPILPSFVSTCLNLLNGQGAKKPVSSLQLVVLDAFNWLLPTHSTVFRPFASRIHQSLLAFLSTSRTPSQLKASAEDLFVSLHYCASKNAMSHEWENAFLNLVSCAHHSADQLFRPVLEDWQSSDERRRQHSVKHEYDDEVSGISPDPLGFPIWNGTHEGADRILQQTQLLTRFLQRSSAVAVSLPVGVLLDLVTRLNCITTPGQGSKTGNFRPNPEVSREEREELFLEIPRLHQATLELFGAFISSLGRAGQPVYGVILNQLSWVFNAERENESIRKISYQLLRQLLPYVGCSLTKADIRAVSPIILSSTRDLCPTDNVDISEASSKINGSAATNADSFMKKTSRTNSCQILTRQHLSSPAWLLLPCIFQFIPSSVLPYSLRTELDRTAIMASHKEALLASTLNPPPVLKGKLPPPSLLPFLARAVNENDLALESLLRPRVPPIFADQGSEETTNGLHSHNNDVRDLEMNDETAPLPWQTNAGPNRNSLLDQLEDSLPDASPSMPADYQSSAPNILSASLSGASSPHKRGFSQIDSTAESASKFEKQEQDVENHPAEHKKPKIDYVRGEKRSLNSTIATQRPELPTMTAAPLIPSTTTDVVPRLTETTPEDANLTTNSRVGTEHASSPSAPTLPHDARTNRATTSVQLPVPDIETRGQKGKGRAIDEVVMQDNDIGENVDEDNSEIDEGSDLEIPKIDLEPDTDDEDVEDDDGEDA